jgi:hypothetical protein
VIVPSGSLPIAIGNGVPKNILPQLVMDISRLRSGNSRIRRATAFIGSSGPLSWLASALVAAGFAAGSSVFAQYPASGQPYSTPYTPGSVPAFTQSAPAQSANQTDEQLLTVGRLLEQQGRYAQAQRIYTELERRRLSGAQQPAQAPANIPYQQQVPYQSANSYQPQNLSPPPAGMMPQASAAPINWQNAPVQMPNQLPMMQFAPQGNVPGYEPSTRVVAAQAPPAPATQLPPPAPPSEAYVVDTEVTPQAKTTGISDTQGWQSAVSPLPAAFKAWNSDRPAPYQDHASSSLTQPSPRNAAAEQTSLPDLPIAPIAPLNSTAKQFASTSPQVPTNSPRYVSPMISNGERRAPLGPDQQLAVPPTLRLGPLPSKGPDNFDAEREVSQKQTDAIRIIPGQRGLLQLKPETGANQIDPRPTGFADDKPPLAGDLKPPAAIAMPEPRASSRTEPPGSDRTSRFDLAAWVSAPEFREIHTADVIAGLDLLVRPEARYRAAGATRIAAAGESARTALPILRKVLTSETDRTVRLRIAEALLKLQPNDRAATECLSDLLAGRNEAELRQAAAAALGSAAAGRNPIAVASLTDALDDASPQVRSAAATSLGLFGRSAAGSTSRLENAAINDIPTVRQAATLALASIRGIPAEQSPAPRESASLFKPQATGQLALEATPTGRAKLIDRLPTRPVADSPFAQQDAATSQPKLFPSDRINGSRVPAPAQAKSDDDAIPISATAPEAPSKPFVPAKSSIFQPLQFNLAPPLSDTGATSAPSDETPTFLLQSEPGASKAGSKP